MILLVSISSILVTYNVISLKNNSYYLEIGGLAGLILYIIRKIRDFK